VTPRVLSLVKHATNDNGASLYPVKEKMARMLHDSHSSPSPLTTQAQVPTAYSSSKLGSLATPRPVRIRPNVSGSSLYQHSIPESSIRTKLVF